MLKSLSSQELQLVNFSTVVVTMTTIIIPAAVTAGLQDVILVILGSFLVYLHQFLPSDLPVKNPLEVVRRPGHFSSLRLGEFLLARLPFLPTLGNMNPNTAGPEVSTTDVAGHEGWRHGCVGSQSGSQTVASWVSGHHY